MAEVTVVGEVNVSHLAHLLADSLRDEGLRVVGPDEDGQTIVRAHGVGEERLLEAIGQTDPAWTPPAPEPEPDPVEQAEQLVAEAFPDQQQRDAVLALVAALTGRR